MRNRVSFIRNVHEEMLMEGAMLAPGVTRRTDLVFEDVGEDVRHMLINLLIMRERE